MLPHHDFHQALITRREQDLRRRAEVSRLAREARPERAPRRPAGGRRLVAVLFRFTSTALHPVDRTA